MKYTVNFKAIYDVIVVVEASSEKEAIEKAKDGNTIAEQDDQFDRIHPETEFFVTEGEVSGG